MTKSALSTMTRLADHRALLVWVADTFAAAFLHNGAHRSYAGAQQAGGGLDDRELRAIAVVNAWDVVADAAAATSGWPGPTGRRREATSGRTAPI